MFWKSGAGSGHVCTGVSRQVCSSAMLQAGRMGVSSSVETIEPCSCSSMPKITCLQRRPHLSAPICIDMNIILVLSLSLAILLLHTHARVFTCVHVCTPVLQTSYRLQWLEWQQNTTGIIFCK